MGGGYSELLKNIIEAHSNTFRLAQKFIFNKLKSITMFKKPLLLLISALMLSCSNSIELGGIMDEVEVLRDNYGINHIYANNQNDLFFMQGYLAAKIDYFNLKYGEDKLQGLFQKYLVKMSLREI